MFSGGRRKGEMRQQQPMVGGNEMRRASARDGAGAGVAGGRRQQQPMVGGKRERALWGACATKRRGASPGAGRPTHSHATRSRRTNTVGHDPGHDTAHHHPVCWRCCVRVSGEKGGREGECLSESARRARATHRGRARRAPRVTAARCRASEPRVLWSLGILSQKHAKTKGRRQTYIPVVLAG